MDRRHFLGLTGASVTALLGGCSSSDGGGTATPTATDTATATGTATQTDTQTATETEEPTETPKEGSNIEITEEHEQYAESIGKSNMAGWWVVEHFLGDSTDIDGGPVASAEAGTKAEAAAMQVNPEEFEGGLVEEVEEQGDVYYSAPDMERTRNIAEYLSTFLEKETSHETPIALPRPFLHNGMPVNGVFMQVDDYFTVANPKDLKLIDNHVLNAIEGADYFTATRKEIANMPDEEVVLGTAVNTEFGPEGEPKSSVALADSESVIRALSDTSSENVIGYQDAYSEATIILDSSEEYILNDSGESRREHPALAMREGGIRVTGHKMQPYEEDGKLKIRDMFGLFDIVDRINEQVSEFDQFQNWDVYVEEGMPDELGAVVDSNEDDTEYDVTVDWADNIAYGKI